jgi:hypothetical protein
VFASLAEEGYQITASRVPLSRERIPEAADLDTLQSLHAALPEGADIPAICCVGNATARCMPWADGPCSSPQCLASSWYAVCESGGKRRGGISTIIPCTRKP